MYRQIGYFAAFILCAFSITVTVIVWSSAAVGVGAVLLGAVAIGFELAKYSMLPLTMQLWSQPTKQFYVLIVGAITVILMVVSMATMKTYLESFVAQQESILERRQANTLITQQNTKNDQLERSQALRAGDLQLKAKEQLLDSAVERKKRDHLTISERLLTGIVKAPVIHVEHTQHTQHVEQPNPVLLAQLLPENPANRDAIFWLIVAVIDITAIVLIVGLRLTSSEEVLTACEKTLTDCEEIHTTAVNNVTQLHAVPTDSTEQKVTDAILSVGAGSKVIVRKIIADHNRQHERKVRHDQLKTILEGLEAQGRVKKEGKFWIRCATSLQRPAT